MLITVFPGEFSVTFLPQSEKAISVDIASSQNPSI